MQSIPQDLVEKLQKSEEERHRLKEFAAGLERRLAEVEAQAVAKANSHGSSETADLEDLHAKLLRRVEVLECHSIRAITMTAEAPQHHSHLDNQATSQHFKMQADGGELLTLRESSTTDVGDAIEVMLKQSGKQLERIMTRVLDLEDRWGNVGPGLPPGLPKLATVRVGINAAKERTKELEEEVRELKALYAKEGEVCTETAKSDGHRADNGDLPKDSKDEVLALRALVASSEMRTERAEDALLECQKAEESLLDCQAKLEKAEQALQAQQRCTNTQADAELLRLELEDMRQAFAKVQDELAFARQQFDLERASLNKHLESLRREHEIELKQCRNEAEINLHKVKAAFAADIQLEADLRARNPQGAILSSDSDSLPAADRQELQKLEIERAIMQNTISQLQTQLQQVQADDQTSRSHLGVEASVLLKNSNTDAELVSLREQVVGLQSIIEKERFTHGEELSKMRALLTNQNHQQDDIASLRAQISDLESLLALERNRKAEDATHARDELATLRAKFLQENEQLVMNNAILRDDNSHLEASLKVVDREKQELLQRIQALIGSEEALAEANATILELRSQIEQDLRSMTESSSCRPSSCRLDLPEDASIADLYAKRRLEDTALATQVEGPQFSPQRSLSVERAARGVLSPCPMTNKTIVIPPLKLPGTWSHTVTPSETVSPQITTSSGTVSPMHAIEQRDTPGSIAKQVGTSNGMVSPMHPIEQKDVFGTFATVPQIVTSNGTVSPMAAQIATPSGMVSPMLPLELSPQLAHSPLRGQSPLRNNAPLSYSYTPIAASYVTSPAPPLSPATILSPTAVAPSQSQPYGPQSQSYSVEPNASSARFKNSNRYARGVVRQASDPVGITSSRRADVRSARRTIEQPPQQASRRSRPVDENFEKAMRRALSAPMSGNAALAAAPVFPTPLAQVAAPWIDPYSLRTKTPPYPRYIAQAPQFRKPFSVDELEGARKF